MSGCSVAVGGEADRPAIAERHRAPLAVAQIGLHGLFFGAVVDGDFVMRQVHRDLLVGSGPGDYSARIGCAASSASAASWRSVS